jgi:gluconolactonase
MTFDRQGRLLICEGDNRQVTRREADGTYTPLAQRLGGKRINRPNDLVTRSDGSIYFTDPGGRLTPAERELDFSGVHRIAPDGTLTNATAETEYPNGLAFSPDERILYVAITRRDERCIEEKTRGEVCTHQCIRAFDVAADGRLSNNRIFANMATAADGVPDGMKVDVEGRVYCTGPEGVWVFDPSGHHLGVIRLPEIPANCAWGGPDHRTMLFTARTSVYSMRMKTPGTRIPRAA